MEVKLPELSKLPEDILDVKNVVGCKIKSDESGKITWADSKFEILPSKQKLTSYKLIRIKTKEEFLQDSVAGCVIKQLVPFVSISREPRIENMVAELEKEDCTLSFSQVMHLLLVLHNSHRNRTSQIIGKDILNCLYCKNRFLLTIFV
ncbi:hypothetical protein J6590_055098 [Homalodisca vitripennis]|nr:hypothetical protein J6590_055098 [Homalodisca vitripennis]